MDTMYFFKTDLLLERMRRSGMRTDMIISASRFVAPPPMPDIPWDNQYVTPDNVLPDWFK
jgi:hypothetical protein